MKRAGDLGLLIGLAWKHLCWLLQSSRGHSRLYKKQRISDGPGWTVREQNSCEPVQLQIAKIGGEGGQGLCRVHLRFWVLPLHNNFRHLEAMSLEIHYAHNSTQITRTGLFLGIVTMETQQKTSQYLLSIVMNKNSQIYWPWNYFNIPDILPFHTSLLRVEGTRMKRRRGEKIRNKNRRKGRGQYWLWAAPSGPIRLSCVGKHGVHQLHWRGGEVEIKSERKLCRQPIFHQPTSGWNHFLCRWWRSVLVSRTHLISRSCIYFCSTQCMLSESFPSLVFLYNWIVTLSSNYTILGMVSLFPMCLQGSL